METIGSNADQIRRVITGKRRQRENFRGGGIGSGDTGTDVQPDGIRPGRLSLSGAPIDSPILPGLAEQERRCAVTRGHPR